MVSFTVAENQSLIDYGIYGCPCYRLIETTIPLWYNSASVKHEGKLNTLLVAD